MTILPLYTMWLKLFTHGPDPRAISRFKWDGSSSRVRVSLFLFFLGRPIFGFLSLASRCSIAFRSALVSFCFFPFLSLFLSVFSLFLHSFFWFFSPFPSFLSSFYWFILFSLFFFFFFGFLLFLSTFLLVFTFLSYFINFNCFLSFFLS